MTPFTALCFRFRFGWPITLLLLLTFASLTALAQSTGSLSGRVSDARTGFSLQGAVVRVSGSTAIAYTDANGRYSLTGLPAGFRRVEVEYVGLDPLSREVEILSGTASFFDAPLESRALQLEAFTVAESVRGQALAINQQKTASGLVNIVSEETFNTNLGGNLGFTLQQLPGLSVNEGEDGEPSGVNIRGLEAKYNSVQVDGNRMPSSGNSRAFSVGQLNADAVANIEVIKAATPDRDGDALGGIINVVSRSAFQREGRAVEFNVGGLYYDKREQWNYNAAVNYLDIFSVGGGQRNLGVGINLAWSETSRDYDNLDKDYAVLQPQFEPALRLTGPLYFHTNAAPQTNFRTTSALSANLALDYRIGPGTTLYLRPFFRHQETDAEKPRARYYVNSNHNFNSATGTKSIAEATYNTGRSLPTILTELRYQNDVSFTDNDVYGASFGGQHRFNGTVISVDLFRSNNDSNRDRSLAYVVRNQGYQFGYDQSTRWKPVYTILNGKDPYDVATINRGDLTYSPRDATEKATSAKVDVERKFAGDRISGALKFGAKFRSNVKEQDQASIVYQTGSNAAGFPYASILTRTDYKTFGALPIYQYPDLNRLDALRQSSPQLFTLQVTSALQNDVINDYRAQEDTTAAYAMGTLRFGASTLIGGLRIEHNTFSSHTYRYNSNAPAAPTAVDADRSYTRWLPGLHLRHELAKNLILRESYHRSYSRPDVNALVAGLNLDTTTGNISGGNPNLQPSTAHNFDVQLEYYTPKGGLYSAGVFYKRMKGFYYESTLRFTATDANGYPIPDPNGTRTYTTTDNALGATNYGVELIARQKLLFLPAPFNGLGVALSGTFTTSDGKYPGRLDEDLPTYGFSDKIYNAALEYAGGGFRARLSYTYRSDFLEGLDANSFFDDWFGAYESLNWESSYQLSRQTRIFFHLNNLLDEPQISYQGYRRTDNPEDYTTYSWRATVGMSYRF
ncbi:MAG: TonB-dependent receptor [Verrucomicrobia bacterium]|nr:TonB-dependent receptor [Verrucomicrobiota bacterium]